MRLRQTIGVAALCLFSTAPSLKAQTTLRLQFKEGDKYGYVLEQKMKSSASVMGKDIEVNINQNMEMSWQVIKVANKDTAEVKIAFQRVKMAMDGPMGKVEVDSKGLKEVNDPAGKVLSQVVATLAGMEMSFTMDTLGHIKDIKIPEKVKASLKDLPGGESMRELFSDDSLKKMAHGGLVLPTEAVTKGKTWAQKADMKIPMGKVKGDIQYTYEGPVDLNGRGLEKIAFKPNITLESEPGAAVQMKFKSQDGKGTLYFDNAAGRMVEINSLQNMEMTIEVNNMTILQKIEQHTTMKIAK